MRELSDQGLVVGSVLSGEDLVKDPHVAARRNIVTVSDGRAETIPMPAALQALSESPGAVRHAAPALGEHTRKVLVDELHISPEEYQSLVASGVVNDDGRSAALTSQVAAPGRLRQKWFRNETTSCAARRRSGRNRHNDLRDASSPR